MKTPGLSFRFSCQRMLGVIEGRGSKDPTLDRLMQNRRGGATELDGEEEWATSDGVPYEGKSTSVARG
jgi:hypothetical protein